VLGLGRAKEVSAV